MRRIDALLNEYGESHQDHTNKAIHWICVPAIFWCVTALVWSLPQPAFMANIVWLNWLSLSFAAALIYYLMLSPPLAVGFAIVVVACVFISKLVMAVGFTLWHVAIVVFVLAWIGQFWGHKIEGKKPSFFKDVQFLLIGPAWLMSFIYKRLGLSY